MALKVSTESIYKFLTTLGLLALTFSIGYGFNYTERLNSSLSEDKAKSIKFMQQIHELNVKRRFGLKKVPENIYSISRGGIVSNGEGGLQDELSKLVLLRYYLDNNNKNSIYKKALDSVNYFAHKGNTIAKLHINLNDHTRLKVQNRLILKSY